MVSDPEKMALLGMHLKIEAALAGLDFPSPRYSRKTGEPLPKPLRRTLLDPSVWSAERITFCARPGISDAMRDAGWTVADAAIEIVNADAGPFDLSWLKPPTAERLRLYYEATGEFLSISGAGRSLCANSRGVLGGIDADREPSSTARRLDVRHGRSLDEGQRVRAPAL